MKKHILLASLFALLFSACSTKEVYEPISLGEDWSKYESVNETIVDKSLNIALLDNSKVLVQEGVLDVEIEESHRVISYSDGWVVSASIDGNITMKSAIDPLKTENFELKKTVAAASVNGDTLAVLFADNEIAIYSIASKSPIFKEQGGKSLAVDSRIVNPHFMNDLILFSTLDGKIIIVNAKLKKKLRTVIVSSEDNFNNIIYLNVIDNKVVAATSYKMISMSANERRVKYEIRDIVYDDKDIFISTKQGEIVSITPNLDVNAKVKFPFAHFLGMIAHEDKLYVLEKEGYLIVLDKDLKNYTVHEVDIEDGFVFIADKLFYVADEKISVE
ncbi:MAG: hypothetical protein U9Q40_11925 [Campylobacterota bacterium]|nr:hypothetical protein [Campylobacterota bacterium]